MTRFLRGFLTLWLLVAVLVALPADHANAATAGPNAAAAPAATTTSDTEGFDVLTSPLPIKIDTPPGKTVTEELRIKNEATEAEGIKVGLMKFGATGELGRPDLYDLTAKDTYASWVHFSPQQFLAQPNVWNTVKMTINIPANASLGYYLAVTFSPANQPGGRDVTNLRGSAAQLVLLNVESPNEKRSLQLTNFSTNHKLYEYLPADFNIRVHNNGNIYLPPTGNIFIMKGSKTIDTLDLNDAGGSVLPNSNRVFTVPWTDGFPVFQQRLVHNVPITDSHGNVEETLHWNFTQANKFRFGEYTAKLLVVYDNGKIDVPLESTLTFWVLPWKLMLLALVIILIIGFGIFTLIRSTVGLGRSRVPKRGGGSAYHRPRR
jgi:hypothetical protein